MQVPSLGGEDPLAEGTAAYCLPCSCLESLMDGGAWWAAVHRT